MELQPEHPHVVHLQGRRANVQGAGEVGLSDLVRAAMRMRADRLVLGECRGEEVRDLLADRKSTRLNSSHVAISYAVFCLKKKKESDQHEDFARGLDAVLAPHAAAARAAGLDRRDLRCGVLAGTGGGRDREAALRPHSSRK